MKERKFFGFGKNVFVAGLVSFFMDVSSEMIYPLVPLFLANVLGVNKSVIGLIEGIAESTASLLKTFSGWLSDRIGNRKWFMAAGYGISTLSRPVVALATGWHHVMGSRFMDRFGKGVRTAPHDAIIAESSESAFLGRAFSFHRSLDTMGAVVGPAFAFFFLGIFLNDYRKVFWLSMIPGTIAVLLIIFFIKEKKKKRAFLATIIPTDFKATAFGVYNTTIGLAMFPASLIGGWLWDHVSPAATFYYGTITAGLSAVLFIVFIAAIKRNITK